MKYVIVFFILFFQVSFAAPSFSKVATLKPVLTQSGSEKHWCPVCGMDIKTYYKTSHASKLQNGRNRQYCSLHCLAVDMKEYDIDKKNIQVVDAHTQKLIDAHSAYYVLYSKVKGTMSYVSKLAFAKQSDAQDFIANYGGKIVSFDEALKQTQDSLKTDIKNQKKIKNKKVYPMGKKIYESKCKKDLDLSDFLEVNELKAKLQTAKPCGSLKEKHLHALSMYLWEVKRVGEIEEVEDRIKLEGGEKCPVCGMFVYKYPKWAAQIFYKHNGHEHHYSFDGVKDMMKFYFSPLEWGDYKTSTKENISKILVTDYYSQKAIDGTKAYYVVGSDIYGPMGDELIPFKNKSDAQTFKMDHRGKKILKFDEISQKAVYDLDR